MNIKWTMDQSLENNTAKEINSKSTNSCYSKLKKGKQQFFPFVRDQDSQANNFIQFQFQFHTSFILANAVENE